MVSALKPVSHGTPGGYQTHWLRGELPCDDCRAAWNDDRGARRVRGGQAQIRVPVEVVGSLLIAAANHVTRQWAVTVLGPRTAAVCIDRAVTDRLGSDTSASAAAARRPAVVRQE